MKTHSQINSLKIQKDLSKGRWEISYETNLENLLDTLINCSWIKRKDGFNRAVYSVDSFFVKIYLHSGFINRIKRFWRNKAFHDWCLSSQLRSCFIGTPKPIAICIAKDFSIFVNTSVEPCRTVEDYLKTDWNLIDNKKRYQIVDSFSDFIINLFRCGLYQKDYNLGNLLIRMDTGQLYIVDMQMARLKRKALSIEDMASNLSYLLPCFQQIDNRYKLRFFLNITKSFQELKKHLWTIQSGAFRKMRRHWLKKAKRVLTRQTVRKHFFDTQAMRGYLSHSIDPMIRQHITSDPERLFDFTETLLKRSKRAKLAIIKSDDQRYFLKRYNVKSWRHRIKRVLGRSPARRIWLNNHLFQIRGFSTSRLLAAVDVGKGLHYLHSYALYDYLDEASDSVDRLNTMLADTKKQHGMMKRLAWLAWEMHQKGIHHGDLKISNIIWGTTGKLDRIHVIDLDAVKFRRSIGDRQRLSDLKNMASYFWMLDLDPCKTDRLFDAYVGFHIPWQNKQNRLHRSFRKMAHRQFRHRLKRDRLRAET